MKQSIFKALVMTAVGGVFALAGTLSASAATPKKGGILNFVVGIKIDPKGAVSLSFISLITKILSHKF